MFYEYSCCMTRVYNRIVVPLILMCVLSQILLSCRVFGQSYIEKKPLSSTSKLWIVTVYIGPYASLTISKSAKFMGKNHTVRFVRSFTEALISTYFRDKVLDPYSDAATVQTLRTTELPNAETSQDTLFAIVDQDPETNYLLPENFLATFRVSGPNPKTGKLPLQESFEIPVLPRCLEQSNGSRNYYLEKFPKLANLPLETKIFTGGFKEVKNYSKPSTRFDLRSKGTIDAVGFSLGEAINELKYRETPVYIEKGSSIPYLDHNTSQTKVIYGPAVLFPNTLVAEVATPNIARDLGLEVMARLNPKATKGVTPIFFGVGSTQDFFQANFRRTRHMVEKIYQGNVSPPCSSVIKKSMNRFNQS
jgi:hypothetical protein